MVLQRLGFGFLLVCFSSGFVTAQFGGGLQAPVKPAQAPVKPVQSITGPSSATAQTVIESLDVQVKLGEIRTELGDLGELLTKTIEIPVFVDQRSIEMAELALDTVIEADLPELPLRSALRRLLQPKQSSGRKQIQIDLALPRFVTSWLKLCPRTP